MTELAPWLFGLLVLVVVVISLVVLFRRRRPTVSEDSYAKGLELWLAGRRQEAIAALKAAIARDPDSIDPYLQLGNFLRQNGDAKRAAVLHRGLTVRNDVPHETRFSISLALAEDLIALAQWGEAGKVLDSLASRASGEPRYWSLRFAQAIGRDDSAAAAKVLQDAAARCRGGAADSFREQYGYFQLDRCLQACRVGDAPTARQLLKQVPETEKTATGRIYIRILAALLEHDFEATVTAATEGLLHDPTAADLFLPPLQEALLQSGHYTRTIPILESVCERETAPASLWVALALLYEKIGDRESAVRLLVNKADDRQLTPDLTAPYLDLLVKELPESPFRRIWQGLVLPEKASGWVCNRCGDATEDIRWFCRICHATGSFVAGRTGGDE
ncbi:MAG: tetratricopeptide repeat protein [bacterium]